MPDRSLFGRNVDNVSDAGSERGGGRLRDFGNWERKGPLTPGPVREGGRQRSNEGPRFRKHSPGALGEARSQDGSRPPRRDIQPPSAAELDTTWRARMRPDPPPVKEPSVPSSPVAAPVSPVSHAPVPATRPKLNLQKRTVAESPAAPIASESKASIFGGAKPIDSAARERQVEERRDLASRQKKEADEKARAEKAEKAEKQKQAKEQAKAEKAAAVIDPNGRDVSEIPQGGKNFDILRQAGEDGTEGAGENDTEAQEGEDAGKAQETETAGKANGQLGQETTETVEAGDDEGWSTVATKQRNNRRGRAAA